MLFRTKTLWNTNAPVWEETFTSPYDNTIIQIVYQLYDDDMNPYYPPRRMGIAILNLQNVQPGVTHTQWLPLSPNLVGDSATGDIKVSVLIQFPKKFNYEEFLLILTGVILTTIGLIMGFYEWRNMNIEKPLCSLPIF